MTDKRRDDEIDGPDEFDWQWIQQASQHELSAHGRQVQAKPPWQPAAGPARPSLLKRMRFRLYLLFGGRPG